MFRHFPLVVVLLVTGSVVADDAIPSLDGYRDTVKAIIDEALTNRVGYEKLRELTTKAPRRLSGSTAAAAAVEWARQAMIRDGFENVRLQPVMVPHWERGDVAELHIVAPAGAAGESLRFLALGGSIATPPEGITAQILQVKSFEELAAKKDQAVGKIIFFNRPMDPTLRNTFEAYGGAVNQRSQGAVYAARAGGLAVLVRSMASGLNDVPHTGGMHYSDGTPRVPAAAVSTVAAERLAMLLATGRAVTVSFRQNCKWHEDAPSFNVIGELRGSTLPDEVVVVGGHLDSWDVGQGAHDDGSGVVHAMEVVRILKALGLRPRRTIRVVAFMLQVCNIQEMREWLLAQQQTA